MNDMAGKTTRYDSADESHFDAVRIALPDTHAIPAYLGDMLALERHIREPLSRQLEIEETAAYGDAREIIAATKRLADTHIEALEMHLDLAGGDPGEALKSAWGQMLGAGATLIDSLRKTKVSKNLRDDFAALSLANVSYTMLHATALGLGDEDTAILAKRHLEDYAAIVVQISKAIPAVVLQELRDTGERVMITATALAERNATEAWHRAGGR